MSAKIDITGHTYGRLTVLKEVGRLFGKVLWLCQCSCGNTIELTGNAMRTGNTLSCGCLNTERITTHGWACAPIYKVYRKMLDRCNNPKAKDYGVYGGRGIKVCEEWHDINLFAEWAYSNGYKKGLQIDRRDNDSGYNPDNCRFVTRSININNRGMLRNNHSGYTGVCWHKREKKFQANIYFQGERKYLGYHATAFGAAHARDLYILDKKLPHKLQTLVRTT